MENETQQPSSSEPSILREIDKELRQGNTPAAMALANKAMEEAKAGTAPGKIAEAWLLFFHVHRFLQNHAEALRALEAGLASLPGPDDSLEFAKARLSCLGALGMTHISARRFEKAKPFLHRALAVAGVIPGEDAVLQKLVLTGPMAWLMMQSGEIEQARELATNSIKAWPNRPELYQALGRMLALLVHCRALSGQASLLEPADIPKGVPLPPMMEAVVQYIRVTASPEDGKGPLEKAEVLCRMARWAAGWLERVAGAQTRLTPDCLMMQAGFEAETEDFPAMAETLAKAARIYGERSERVLMLRAERARVTAFARAGELAKALAASDSLVATLRADGDDGATAECLVENGHIRIGLEDFSGADRSFSGALELLVESPNRELEGVAHLSLAMTGAKAGRRDDAERHLKAVTTLLPESHNLNRLASQNLKALTAAAEAPVPQPQPSRRADMASLIKESLPPELAGRMESILKMAESLPKPSGNAPRSENERMLADLEARAMQNLQGILGQFKGM